MKAPFKRGALLTYTNPTTGAVSDAKYVKWMGFERSSLIVIQVADTGAKITVHIDDVKLRTVKSNNDSC